MLCLVEVDRMTLIDPIPLIEFTVHTYDRMWTLYRWWYCPEVVIRQICVIMPCEHAWLACIKGNTRYKQRKRGEKFWEKVKRVELFTNLSLEFWRRKKRHFMGQGTWLAAIGSFWIIRIGQHNNNKYMFGFF